MLYGNSLNVVTPRDLWKQNGFINRTDSEFTFTDATRVFSIQPVAGKNYFEYLIDGVSYKCAGATLTIADVDGLHVIYFDGDTLTEAVNPTMNGFHNIIMNGALVSMIMWDEDNSTAIYIGEERHGATMAAMTHSYLHFKNGLVYDQGLGLNNMSVDENGSQDAHAQFGIDAGVVYDEDLRFGIDAVSSTTGLPIYYMLGNKKWRKKVVNGFSVYNADSPTGRLYYNENNSGNWQLTEVPEGDFVLYHVFATTDRNHPMVVIMGQETYSSKRKARAGAKVEVESLVLQRVLFPEARPIATVIFQTDKDYTNSVKARIVSTDTGDNYIDWRNEVISRVAVTTTDHNALSGQQGGDLGEYFHLTESQHNNLTKGNPTFNTLTLTDLLNLQGVTSDPSSPAESFIWFRSDLGELRIRIGTTTYKFNLTSV